jgi:hypothetical protein
MLLKGGFNTEPTDVGGCIPALAGVGSGYFWSKRRYALESGGAGVSSGGGSLRVLVQCAGGAMRAWELLGGKEWLDAGQSWGVAVRGELSRG